MAATNRITKHIAPPTYTHGYDCECPTCSNCEPAPPIRVSVGPDGVRVVQPCSESRAAWLEKFADYGRRERAEADDFAQFVVILVTALVCGMYSWGLLAVVGR